MEKWKVFADGYEISNHGNIRNKKTGRILKSFDNGNGYRFIKIKNKNYYIHRLVAMAFLDNSNGFPDVNHKDYNRSNNDVTNLEWLSTKDNVNYSSNNMRKPKAVTHSNTGVKYITFVNSHKKYRVTIKNRYRGEFCTLHEAIQYRDELLKEVVL